VKKVAAAVRFPECNSYRRAKVGDEQEPLPAHGTPSRYLRPIAVGSGKEAMHDSARHARPAKPRRNTSWIYATSGRHGRASLDGDLRLLDTLPSFGTMHVVLNEIEMPLCLKVSFQERHGRSLRQRD